MFDLANNDKMVNNCSFLDSIVLSQAVVIVGESNLFDLANNDKVVNDSSFLDSIVYIQAIVTVDQSETNVSKENGEIARLKVENETVKKLHDRKNQNYTKTENGIIIFLIN